ncbi:MAG: hypothetical protein PVI06_13160 [Desulfobacterales bacterium]|jgi:hypothetical protein
MKLRLFLLTLFLSLSLQACTTAPVPVPFPKSPAPQYFKLKIPQSEIPLPAVIVGQQEQLSGGCFASDVQRTTTTGFEEFVEKALRQKDYEAGLKVAFEKAMIKAGLDLSASRALMQSWQSEIKGVKIDQVDPSEARPNFTNQACRIEDLKWFENKRVIVTGGLLADTLQVKMAHSLDADQKAELMAAVARLNSEIGLSFRNVIDSEDAFEWKASDVYFGAFTSQLSSKRCKKELEMKLGPGQSGNFGLCGNAYIVTVRRSEGSNRFTINIAKPDEGIETGQLDIEANRGSARALGQNRFVSLFINEPIPEANEQKLNVSILLVGVSGE